jgi:hypothetical protein
MHVCWGGGGGGERFSGNASSDESSAFRFTTIKETIRIKLQSPKAMLEKVYLQGLSVMSTRGDDEWCCREEEAKQGMRNPPIDRVNLYELHIT